MHHQHEPKGHPINIHNSIPRPVCISASVLSLILIFSTDPIKLLESSIHICETTKTYWYEKIEVITKSKLKQEITKFTWQKLEYSQILQKRGRKSKSPEESINWDAFLNGPGHHLWNLLENPRNPRKKSKHRE